MKKFLINLSLIAVCGLVPLVSTGPIYAQNFRQEACRGANLGQGGECKETGLTNTFKLIINALIFLVGAISVLMLIIGAIRYVTSAGSPEAVKGATGTILYAIIGIIVATVAFAIVNFVIARLQNPPSQ